MLGRDEHGRQLIETVARRGYRIAAPVRILNAGEAAPVIGGRTDQKFFGESGDLFENQNAEFSAADVSSLRPEFATVNPPSEMPAEAAAPASRKRRDHPLGRPAIFLGLGILILLTLGFGTYRFLWPSAEGPDARLAPIEQLRFQRLTDSGDVVYPTISPNGEMLAYVRLEDENGSLWIKQIATDNPTRILPASNKGYRSLTFSPDGKFLFFRDEADSSPIYQTSILGGPPKKVADNVWSDFAISPDGRQFSFIRRDLERKRDLLILSNLDGTGEREVSAKQSPADYRSTPAFSPDGSTIVVSSGVEKNYFPKLLTVNLADGAETELKTPRWRAIHRALWRPDGKNLIISARDEKESYSQLWLMSYPDGEVSRLTNDLEAYFWISLSADGRMVVTRQQRIFSHLWLLPDGDLKKAKQLTFGGRNLDGYAGLAWSSDDKIIYSVFANNVTELYSIDADGGNRVKLTANAGQDNTAPAVSPDGRFIVFISNRTGTNQIWRMDIEGGNQKQLTFTEDSNERVQTPTFSADGTEILFIKRAGGSSAVWKIPVDGGAAVQVSRLVYGATEGFIALSPDGKNFAYHHLANKPAAGRERPKFRIGVLPADGSAPEPQVFDLDMRRPFVQWTSAATFDYSSGTFNNSTLWRQSIAGGAAEKLIDFPDRIFNFAWSNNRKNLAVARGRQLGDALLITNLH
jgi:TolB protein